MSSDIPDEKSKQTRKKSDIITSDDPRNKFIRKYIKNKRLIKKI